MAPNDVPAGVDGGRAALAGFLYQLLGTAGTICSRASGVVADGDIGTAILIAEPETHGQDLVLTQIGGADRHPSHVIQFKYSSRPAEYPIQPAEFIAIVEAMRIADTAVGAGRAGFFLVTNRPNSPGLQRISDELIRGGASPQFNAANRRSEGGASTRAQRKRIASNLRVISNGWENWRTALRNVAESHGILPGELNRAIATVVGQLALISTNPAHPPVTEQMLSEWLVGFANPRKIRRRDLAEVMRRDLEDFRREISCDEILIRREVLETLTNRRDRGVVVLLGSGGCGKSATIYQALRGCLPEGIEPQTYVSATSLLAMPRDWLSSVVHRWRGAGPGAQLDAPGFAVERLTIAHGVASRPVIIVVVDGIDEALATGGDQAARIQELSRLVRDMMRAGAGGVGPSVSLLITCRDEDELERAGLVLRIFEDGETDILRVDDFTMDELAAYCNEVLGGETSSRIRRYASAGRTLADEQAREIPQNVLNSLRHPLLTKFFVSLDDAQRERFLDAEPAAMRELGENYVRWFLSKVQRRILGVAPVDARGILSAVAARSNAMVPYLLQEDWIVHACAGGRFSDGMARQVFLEGISSGLVLREGAAGGWRWRHEFLIEVLMNLTNGQ